MTLHEAYQILAGAYDALHFCEENEAYIEHSASIQTAIENLEHQLDEASKQQDIILADCDDGETQ